MMKSLTSLLLLILLSLSPLRAVAETPASSVSPAAVQDAPSPLSPADAQRALEVLQNPAKRAALIDTLQTIAKAAPADVGTKTAPISTTPAGASTSAAKPATAASTPVVPLAPGSVGAQLLAAISAWLKALGGDIAAAAHSATDFPLLIAGIRQIAADPVARMAVLDALWRIVVVLGGALVAAWIGRLVLSRPAKALDSAAAAQGMIARHAAPASAGRAALVQAGEILRRLPAALARLALGLLPVAAFAGTAVLLMGSGLIPSDRARSIISTVAQAYILFRIITSVTAALVAPANAHDRLVRVDDHLAAYIELWIRRIATIAVFGVAFANVAFILGLGPAPRDLLVKLVALVAHLCLVIIVLQNRQRVAALIAAPAGARGASATLRNRLAETWHDIAIFVILALWLAWALAIREGLSNLTSIVLLSIGVLVGAWLATTAVLGILDRVFHVPPTVAQRYPGIEVRANRYYPLLRRVVIAAIVLIAAVVMLQVWGIDAVRWFRAGSIGGHLVAVAITICVTIALAILVWEFADAAIDRHLARLAAESAVARAARLKTLLPMLRTMLMIAILLVLGLTVLSQIGINIAPLLAGAGIVGIAIGFGSQKLVQDVITGLFLLLENAMQVGDWVTVSGLSGSVEKLSIRTIWLRAGDGSVHIIPFSSVSSVTNTNRGLGNAAVSVEVPWREDPDRVGAMLVDIAAGMRKEPAFEAFMLSDLQLWGVDKVDGSMVTIAGQIVCTDAGRWPVQREFNRRLKLRSQELGVDLYDPRRSFILREPPTEEPKETNDRRPPDRRTAGGGPVPFARDAERS
jgi:small-conductance mechanosensitive channel